MRVDLKARKQDVPVRRLQVQGVPEILASKLIHWTVIREHLECLLDVELRVLHKQSPLRLQLSLALKHGLPNLAEKLLGVVREKVVVADAHP